jgi:hypothetical protein
MRARRGGRRKIALAVAIGGTLVIVGIGVCLALAFRTYQQVKGPLLNAESTLKSLAHNPNGLNSAEGRDLIEIKLAETSREVASAESQINSSVGLKILGVFPGLHAQRVGLDQLVDDLRSTTVNSLALLRSVSAVAADSHGTNISLSSLQSLGNEFGRVKAQLTQADRSSSGLWGPIGADRQKFDREDGRAIRLLSQGIDLTRYALPFLGLDGPRTYLVMGENNAEMRDEGCPLSYSVMNTQSGSISLGPGESVDNIELTSPAPGVVVPTGTQTVFGHLTPTKTWQNSNATADFAFSGRDMQAMFAAATGQHVNGVIGLDVVALQGLLTLTGPVSVPGIPEPVTAQNAAYVLLDQLYQGLPQGSPQAPRNEDLAAVTSAAFHQLQTQPVDLVALARTLATETSERHLQLWDENAEYEKTITEVGASGSVATMDPDRTFHVAVENATATKLDYFVDVAISDTVYVLPNGSALVNTAVTLTNHAPVGQPPDYQLGPDGFNSTVTGEYVGRVLLWSPRGSTQVGGGTPESGLVVREDDIPVYPGKTAIAQFSTTIPHAMEHGKLSLVFVPQPRLSPEDLTIHVTTSGLKAGSKRTFRAPLTKTQVVTWAFS